MSSFKKTRQAFAVFLAGLPGFTAHASIPPMGGSETIPTIDDGAVVLRPLNRDSDNQFAAHRSHASHASHASHYSGTGGGSSVPQDPDASPKSSAPKQSAPPTPQLTREEKLKLQIMRVQLALVALKIYDGEVDGVLTSKTQESLKLLQKLKGLPESGLMTTETMNALGVAAVQ